MFSEAVTGFATGDVTLGGTAGGTLTGTVTGGPTTYNVAVTGMTGPGTVVATIAAGVATDPAGNPQRRLDLDRQHGHVGQRGADGRPSTCRRPPTPVRRTRTT